MSFNDKINYFKIKISNGSKTESVKINVPMFSDFFSRCEKNPLCTNGMYEAFKREVIASVELYKPRQELTLVIYENEPASDLSHEMTLVGFRKYVSLCYKKQKKTLLKRSILFSFLALVGVGCICFANTIGVSLLDTWINRCIENLGCVFLWNFLGYFSFEFMGEKRELDRVQQLYKMEYLFRKWE